MLNISENHKCDASAGPGRRRAKTAADGRRPGRTVRVVSGPKLMPIDRPRRSGPGMMVGSLHDHVAILPTPEMIIRPAVERLLARHGPETLPRSVESVSNAFGRTFTRAGDAIWIISHGVVVTDLADGTLAELAVDAGDSQGPVGLTTRIDTVPTAAAMMFMDTVRVVAERVRG